MVGLEGITRFMSGAGSAKDVYGERVIVPELPDPSKVLRDVIRGNIEAIPLLKDLGIKSTKLYSDMMETAYQGITDLKTSGTAAIKGLIEGKVPGFDEYVQRRGAEFSRESGTSGSQFGFGQELNLGFNKMLQTAQIGLDAATRWISQAQGQTFDFSRMFRGAADVAADIDRQASRDYAAEVARKAPNPKARGKFDAEMSWIGMVLSAYGGGPGYTGQNQNTPGALSSYPQQGQMNMSQSYFAPVQNYGYGWTPPNTSYNAMTDQSTYDPYAGMGSLGSIAY